MNKHMAEPCRSDDELARRCRNFMNGAKKIYDEQGDRADMWFFELFHHLNDCAAALETSPADDNPYDRPPKRTTDEPQVAYEITMSGDNK